MATGWYGRSVAAASLTRLPRGICCGVCGLTEPTPDSTEDGPADTAAAWAAMTRHVLETHCTPCCEGPSLMHLRQQCVSCMVI